MSTLRRICRTAKSAAKKVANKVESIADSAVTAVKIRNLEMKIEEKYEDLGAVVYRDLHTDENLEEEKLRIIAEIDALFDALTELKNPTTETVEEEAPEEVTEETPATEETSESPAEETQE